MAFFRNDTVNWLNLHYTVHALALGGSEAFFAAYLLKAGLPAPQVLTVLAVIFGARFFIRPLVLVLARRVGLRALVIGGTVLASVQYPMLAQVHGLGWPLAVLCLFASAGDTLYWTAYHAYFAALGDVEHRGHQIGAREAAAARAGVVGPLLSGWALTVLGAQVAFGVTAGVMALSALPLLRTPDVAIAPRLPGAFRAALPGVWLYVADGWIGAGFYLVWQIALFSTLGQQFSAYGGAMALAALVGAASGLLLGRWIDLGHGARAVILSLGGLAGAVAFRAIGTGHPVLAVAASAVGAVATAAYTPTLMTAVYNLAKASPCPLRFSMATEGGFDAGCAGSCLTAAALLWSGVPLGGAILPALLGVGGMSLLLRRYYRAV